MKLRPIRAQRLVELLKDLGFHEVRQRGSHLIMENSDGRLVVVPIHIKEIGVGLLRTIVRQLGMSRSDFLEALEKM